MHVSAALRMSKQCFRLLLVVFALGDAAGGDAAGPRTRRYARGLKRDALTIESAASDPPLHRSKGRLQMPPRVLDWRKTEVVTPVKNQGACGMCWAVSSTETIESRYSMYFNKGFGVSLSYQQTASCTKGNDGCCGGCPETVFTYFNETRGWLTNDLYWQGSQVLIGDPPHYCDGDKCTKERCTESCESHALAHDIRKDPDSVGPLVGVVDWSWVLTPCLDDRRCPRSREDWLKLARALAEEGPLTIDVWTDGWDDLNTNEVLTYEKCTDRGRGDHSVQLVGYNLDAQPPYWIVRNSWGSTWGDNEGFLFLEHGKNTCGIGDAVLTVDVKGREEKSASDMRARWENAYEQATSSATTEVIV